jgi:glycosyltransferase involved in cell wall biosynthesis
MGRFSLAIDATAVPGELTGAGYYIQQIISGLSQRDVDLVIITKKNDVERFSHLAPKARIVDTAPTFMAGRLAYQTFAMGKLVDKLGVDVFHGPHYQLPQKISTPSVVTIHDTTLLTHQSLHEKPKTLFFSRAIPRALKNASAVITVSESTKNDLKKLFPDELSAKKYVEVAHLGIDESRFHAQANENEETVLQSLGITQPYVASLGLLEPRKGIPMLVRAFSRLAKSRNDLHLVIAGGEGWGIEEIRNAIKESGCVTRITLAGRLADEEVGLYLRHAHMFVYPSEYEGFGMPVVEAMACGTPTITTRSSALVEVAGKGAMLIDPKNEDQLFDAMNSLCGDSMIRKQMIKRALERAQDFSWNACVDKHIEAYKFAIT